MQVVESYGILNSLSEMTAKALCPQRRRLLLTRTLGGRVRANFFIWNLVLPGMLEGRKGGCTMTFEQVVLLLTLLGGAIYVTFEITWTVSHSDDKKKK